MDGFQIQLLLVFKYASVRQVNIPEQVPTICNFLTKLEFISKGCIEQQMKHFTSRPSFFQAIHEVEWPRTVPIDWLIKATYNIAPKEGDLH